LIYEKSFNITRIVFDFSKLRIYWPIGKLNASNSKKLQATAVNAQTGEKGNRASSRAKS